MDTTMKGDWPIQLIPTDLILPNEQHVEARLLEVIDSIARSGRWTAPIVLESDSLAVMDGHHRLAAAKRGCIWPTAKRASLFQFRCEPETARNRQGEASRSVVEVGSISVA
jgi:hypothetical protein